MNTLPTCCKEHGPANTTHFLNVITESGVKGMIQMPDRFFSGIATQLLFAKTLPRSPHPMMIEAFKQANR